ncbi:MAG: response regulator transcription factor [Acidobacteriota bacterium]|jgi:DNA-binding response OmpR family regulator
MRVLVVEDEQHLAEGLRFNLEAEGFEVTVRDNGEDALAAFTGASAPFDLLILDVMLPGIDGFEVIRRLRDERHYLPTLILTARGRPDDVVKGIAAGADDYLAKPFDLGVLIARIKSLLRRRQWSAEKAALPPNQTVINGRRIDFNTLEIEVDGERQPLTVMEANLLRYLLEREGQPVSRAEILDKVWQVQSDTDTRAIDNFIVRLRKYLETDPTHPECLLTVRGVGYRLNRV